MSLKKIINNKTRSIRVKTGYNTKNNKDIYKRRIKQILISIILVLMVIFIKKLDTNITKTAIELVDKTINYDMEITKVKDFTLKYTKKIINVPKKGISVFNEDSNKEGFIIPVTGEIYKSFGKVPKSNGVEIFNKGVDIIPNRNEVVAISEGVVIEKGKDLVYGNYVKIRHGNIEAYYGGMNAIYVEIGDKVESGEKIGSFNNINKTKFHFEIWEEGSPINPMKKIEFLHDVVLT
ncbi:MAG: M23 family metallopeptidase [Firmicutes bacterium]|nr:M23 family metallopeptidase [Bacillota bacterium]